jgi:GNAT superfamily N-acetyltransferase
MESESPSSSKAAEAALLSRIMRLPVVRWVGKRGFPAPPLRLVCSAVLELPLEELRPGVIHFQTIERAAKGREGVRVLTITETFLGSVVQVSDDLRPHIEQLVRGLIGEGLLREKARTKILQAVEKLAPVQQVWRDTLLFTDRDHFKPDARVKVKRISRDRQRAALGIPARKHFGAGAWQGAAVIVRGRKVVAYADYIQRSPFVSSIGVFTDPDYRGQGFGTTVVSAATKAILRSGRVPIYCTPIGNTASLSLARWLGYVKFGEDSHFFS